MVYVDRIHYKLDAPTLKEVGRKVNTTRTESAEFADMNICGAVPTREFALLIDNIIATSPDSDIEFGLKDCGNHHHYSDDITLTITTTTYESDEDYNKRVQENQVKYDLELHEYECEVQAQSERVKAYDHTVDAYDAVVLQLGSLTV